MQARKNQKGEWLVIFIVLLHLKMWKKYRKSHILEYPMQRCEGFNLNVAWKWFQKHGLVIRGAEYAGSWDPGSQALFVKRWIVPGKA